MFLLIYPPPPQKKRGYYRCAKNLGSIVGLINFNCASVSSFFLDPWKCKCDRHTHIWTCSFIWYIVVLALLLVTSCPGYTGTHRELTQYSRTWHRKRLDKYLLNNYDMSSLFTTLKYNFSLFLYVGQQEHRNVPVQ